MEWAVGFRLVNAMDGSTYVVQARRVEAAYCACAYEKDVDRTVDI